MTCCSTSCFRRRGRARRVRGISAGYRLRPLRGGGVGWTCPGCGRRTRGALGRRRRRSFRRRHAQACPQLRNPAAHRFVLAAELLVLLECDQRPVRITQIEVREYAKVPPGWCVARIGGDGLLVGVRCLLELTAQALRGAKLRPGDGAAALAADRALQGLLRLI